MLHRCQVILVLRAFDTGGETLLNLEVIKGCVAKLRKTETSIARVRLYSKISAMNLTRSVTAPFSTFLLSGGAEALLLPPSEPDLQVSKYPAKQVTMAMLSQDGFVGGRKMYQLEVGVYLFPSFFGSFMMFVDFFPIERFPGQTQPCLRAIFWRLLALSLALANSYLPVLF